MDAWLSSTLGFPVERSYLAVDPRNKDTRVRVVVTDVDSTNVSHAAVPHDKEGVPLVVWSLEDATCRFRPTPGCVRVPAEPYTTPALQAALDAAMAPEHIQPLFRAHSNIEYVMAARCGDDGKEPAVLVGVTAKGYVPVGEDPLPTSIRGVRVCVLDGRASLCGKTPRHKTLERGQDISSVEDGFGTLGGIVWHKRDRCVYLVTAAHVVANVVEGGAGLVVEDVRGAPCITDSRMVLQRHHLQQRCRFSRDRVNEQAYLCGGDLDLWMRHFNEEWAVGQLCPHPKSRLGLVMGGHGATLDRTAAHVHEVLYQHLPQCAASRDATFLDVAFLKPSSARGWNPKWNEIDKVVDGFVSKAQLEVLTKGGKCKATLMGAASEEVNGTVSSGSTHLYVTHKVLAARRESGRSPTVADRWVDCARFVQLVPNESAVHPGDSGAFVYAAIASAPGRFTWQCLGIVSVRTRDVLGRVVCGVCPTWLWPEEWQNVVTFDPNRPRRARRGRSGRNSRMHKGGPSRGSRSRSSHIRAGAGGAGAGADTPTGSKR